MPIPASDAKSNIPGQPTWRDLVAASYTTHDVVSLANEYLGRLEPSDVFLLPNRCKPRRLASPSDVSEFAVDLKSCRCIHPDEYEVVSRVAAFFTEVCQRLAVVTGPQRASPHALWSR